MDIDRRRLLKETLCLAFTGVAGWSKANTQTDSDPAAPSWHQLTRSLLDRARRASCADRRADTSRVERVIRETARAQGRVNPPVIKWLVDPSDAFDHLSRCGLDALLQMGTASLWHRATPSVSPDDRSLDLSFVVSRLVADIVGVEEHDRALMAPKLLARSKAEAGGASAESVFKVRAVSAQVGWLETSMPAAAAQAVADVELLLSAGFSQHDEPIRHQLRVFEAYELGLLATWETPDGIMCVPNRVSAGWPSITLDP